jgi:CBS domain containing-hemolysin-like protein
LEGEPGALGIYDGLSYSLLGVVLCYALYRIACVQYYWHFSNKGLRNEFIGSKDNFFRTNTFLIEHSRLESTLVLSYLLFSTGIFWLFFQKVPFLTQLVGNDLLLLGFLFILVLYLLRNFLPRLKQINHINYFGSLDYIILFLCAIALLPLSLPLSFVQQKINKIFHGFAQELIRKHTKVDLDAAISHTAASEITDAAEKEAELLKSVVKFGEVYVRQIMKSRVDIVAVDKHESFENVVNLVIESGFSRFPVFEEEIDSIVGLLYVKDLLKFMKSSDTTDWQSLIRTNLIFVPESKKINELLREFQSKKFHLAIVVDEFGSTSGIVTLEDIMEEIVGEIKDELDDDTELEYTVVDDHNYFFEGKTLLNDVCRILEIDTDTFDDVKGNADSLAGLLIEILGQLPEEQAEITFKDYTFKVISISKRRIEKVQLTIATE